MDRLDSQMDYVDTWTDIQATKPNVLTSRQPNILYGQTFSDHTKTV